MRHNKHTDHVKRGISLLDTLGPADWRDRISFTSLDFNSPQFCILGQIYGHSRLGAHKLGILGSRRFEDHGFGCPNPDLLMHLNDQELVDTWKDLI